MNRRYTSEEYMEKCGLLRSVYHNPALTTDVIVGFPGETEEDFRESRDFVEAVSFFETHIFPYSRREGTKAAAWTEQLTEAVKKERVRIMLELDARKRREYLESFLGRETEILIEERLEGGSPGQWTGHTREYQRAVIRAEGNLENSLVKCTVQAVDDRDFLICG